MKTIDEYLNESIAYYKELTVETTKLIDVIDEITPGEILQRCATIRGLQESIAEYDKTLHEIMTFIGHEVLENPLVGEYQRALDVAIREADIIESKAQQRKKVLLQDLQKLTEKPLAQKESSGTSKVIAGYGSILQ